MQRSIAGTIYTLYLHIYYLTRIYYLHAIYLDISTADLGLVRVVDQRPLVPVEDEPALVPRLDPRPHLVEVAAAAAAVHHDVPAQLDLEWRR